VQIEVEKEKTKQAEIEAAAAVSKSSGGSTPSRRPGFVAGLRKSAASSSRSSQSISSSHVSRGGSGVASPLSEPDGVQYMRKLKDIVGRVGLTFSNAHGCVALSRGGAAASASPVRFTPPDNDESGADAFYKRMYYYFVCGCSCDASQMSVVGFEGYVVGDTSSPSSGRLI
jgi:hypothetical protein